MNQRKPHSNPADARPMFDEADIGSGEKHPAQHETEDMIRQIPPLPDASRADKEAARGDRPSDQAKPPAPPR